MNPDLKNTAYVSGKFADETITVPSNEVSVEMSNGLRVTLAADREVWYSGPLNYTISVTNLDRMRRENAVIQTTINPRIARLIENANIQSGPFANDIPFDDFPYTYNATSGLLQIQIGDVDSQQELDITFSVNRISNNWTELIAQCNCDDNMAHAISNTVVVTNVHFPQRGGRCYDPFWR